MPKILRVKDTADKYHKKHFLFDIPFRILINGKSQLSGKTTIILGLLLDPAFKYHDKFEGENIYIISDNKLDNKLKLLMDYKEIPKGNYMKYDESILESLYDTIEDKFIEEKEDNKISNRLIIFDDCGYSGNLKNKQNGIISKLISNGRHLNLSQIYSSQRFTMCSTNLRSNLTGAILFNTSMKELDLIAEDFNYLNSKKSFINMFRDETTKTERGFLVINFTNGGNIYMDSEFKTIDISKYE